MGIVPRKFPGMGSEELFAGNSKKNSTNVVDIFCSIGNKKLELVTRNSLDRVMRISSEWVTRSSLDLVPRNGLREIPWNGCRHFHRIFLCKISGNFRGFPGKILGNFRGFSAKLLLG